jgi:hypothetical protein
MPAPGTHLVRRQLLLQVLLDVGPQLLKRLVNFVVHRILDRLAAAAAVCF